MKKLLLLILLSAIFLSSCAKSENTDYIDLTELSSTMVYAEVSNILTNPQKYLDKTIKICGTYSSNYFADTEKNYHFIVLYDELSCCSQGLEFVWNGNHSYPDDYPASGEAIEVTGTFGSYDELGITYYVIFTSQTDIKNSTAS